MVTGRLRAVVLAMLLALALAPTAHAAVTQPLNLGIGENPNATLRADGTADIVWDGRGSNSGQLTYCQLPPTSTACSVQTLLPTGQSDSLVLPIVFGSGTTVKVVSYRYGLTSPSTGFSGTLMYTSTDGGATFDTGVEIGETAPYDLQAGPGNVVSAVTSANQCGGCFQAMPLDGTKATGPAVLSPDYGGLGTITMLDANTPLVVQGKSNGTYKWFRFNGTGDINDAANWTVGADIGVFDYPHLVSGPTGTFMISQDAFSGPNVVVRRWNGNGFDAPSPLQEGTHAQYAQEDASGRIHVVSNIYDPGKTGAALFYASSDAGSNWARERVVYPTTADAMRTAFGTDHYGVLVGRLITDGTIFAARIGPSAAEPSAGAFVGASLVSGTVLIQVPGSKRFVELRKGDVIPVGSLVDATKGRVRVTIALPNGTLQSSDFFQGVFRVTQTKAGLATMALAGGNFKACGGRGAAVVQAAKSKKVVRQLWGAGSGKFRTKGRFAAAAIRGTTWDTIDRCDGTLVRVTQGRVAVTNLKTHKVKVLRKGQSLFVAA